MKTILLNKKKQPDTSDTIFTEFFPREYSVEEFFDIYDNLFYDLSRFHHEIIVEESKNYIGTPLNPKDIEINQLIVQKEDLEFKINSVPQEHPIIKNGSVLQSKEGDDKFYVQDKKLRPITNNNVLKQIKINNGFSPSFPDSKFIIKLDPQAIFAFRIIGALPVESDEDLLLTTGELNEIANANNINLSELEIDPETKTSDSKGNPERT